MMIQLYHTMDSNVSQDTLQTGPRPRWLLLIHRLPPKPDYLRVKVMRRLRRLGARLLKNSVYVLPNVEESLEDFTWLRREIVGDGGEALICEADFLEGLTDTEVEAMWREPSMGVERSDDVGGDRATRGTTWVTRRGVGVDRMASAWLIRRMIDAEARFKFVPPRGYRPAAGEVRFDMYEAEYSHEGDACTFETLVRRFRLDGPPIRVIAEIVHDIDCKDGKFARPEASGVAMVIDAIARAHDDDQARLDRGMALFDDLLAGLERA